MRDVGTSIADLAQYIHELDLEEGSGRHTPLVDRLRSTALKIQQSVGVSVVSMVNLRSPTITDQYLGIEAKSSPMIIE